MTGTGDRAGLAGYGCLLTLSVAGLLGGVGLFLFGLGVYLTAAGQNLSKIEQAHALTEALERAVVLCGFGALSLLIGVVATVVLLKELGDDADRARRGPVEGRD